MEKLKKKRGRPATGRKATYAVTVRLEPLLEKKLKIYLEGCRSKTAASAVLVTALEDFLREETATE